MSATAVREPEAVRPSAMGCPWRFVLWFVLWFGTVSLLAGFVHEGAR